MQCDKIPIWMIKNVFTWNNKNINDFILMYVVTLDKDYNGL